MRVITGIAGSALLAIVVADAFQTVIVARHAQRLSGLTRAFYRLSWAPFASLARFIRSPERRESFLGLYGPLSLLVLLILWAIGVIVPFGMLQWSVHLRLAGGPSSFANDVYFSGAAFFTLGSDQPQNLPSRYLMLLESGFGLSFLGLVIGYLPVLYQSFSSRELRILLLDARAGSPPAALEFLRRWGSNGARLEARLAAWEEWALDLLQTHLSYPMLAFYRSHHPNQSWLAALVAITDVSALAAVGGEEDLKRQAQFTFAAGRHALVHTASLFRVPPRLPTRDRLPQEELSQLRGAIAADQTPLRLEPMSQAELRKLRETYEPYAQALAEYLVMALPPWVPARIASDNWQVGFWGRRD